MAESALRAPARAGSFYPASRKECLEQIASFRKVRAPLPPEWIGAVLTGGLVPHAGWVYSGATAWAVFEALAQSRLQPQTVLIFATAHRPDVAEPSLQAEGVWQVPGGEVQLDAELAQAMLEESRRIGVPLLDRAGAHAGDHAIEVQLPLLQEALPGVRLIPIAMPPGEWGPALGALAAKTAQNLGRRAVALASTDLTHYGPNYYGFAPQGVGNEAHRWSKEVNDRAFLERVLELDAEGAARVAQSSRSACGPSAAAAAVAFAQASGAQSAVLLEHITSWERGPSGRGEPEDFVGYAGVVMGTKDKR